MQDRNENHRKKSLEEVHASVDTTKYSGFWKKLFAFLGPAYLVSVGYMDPGNWATDIAGGSQFGYALIWVLVMSNLMALLLQSLSARLGVVRGMDLAQASRGAYPPVINFFNWILCEIAIAACDLAEVLGMAIGLQLLFGLPILAGIAISVFDTLLILFFMRYGMRKLEAFIIALIVIIGLCFIFEMIFAEPAAQELFKGIIPSIPGTDALYIAVGIIGATVMPHNLYLHSALVQTRKFQRTKDGIRSALKFNFIDTTIALNLALFVNAAILILSAAAFYNSGLTEVSEIQDAHKLLEGVLGTKFAPVLFAVALIAAGQSSTLTGTLAGQIVMEGYLNLRLAPWLRRLLTRLLAVIPAYIVISVFGEEKTADLLVLSQVILSLQLGFAIIPLIHFVSDKQKMGEFVIRRWVKVCAWLVAGIIVSLNIKLVLEMLVEWMRGSENVLLFYLLVLPLVAAAGFLLLVVTFAPLYSGLPLLRRKIIPTPNSDRRFLRKGVPFGEEQIPAAAKIPHGEAKELFIPDTLLLPEKSRYKKIVVTVDFSSADSKAVREALGQGGKDARYVLIHIVETAGALILREDIDDLETEEDISNLKIYREQLEKLGLDVSIKLGYRDPKLSVPDLVKETCADLLVMGAHGHTFVQDLFFGTTLSAVRHRLKIPVVIVR